MQVLCLNCHRTWKKSDRHPSANRIMASFPGVALFTSRPSSLRNLWNRQNLSLADSAGTGHFDGFGAMNEPSSSIFARAATCSPSRLQTATQAGNLVLSEPRFCQSKSSARQKRNRRWVGWRHHFRFPGRFSTNTSIERPKDRRGRSSRCRSVSNRQDRPNSDLNRSSASSDCSAAMTTLSLISLVLII